MKKDMKEEIWRPVRGKEEYAEISNLGQIHYYGTGRGRYPDERWTYGSECRGYLQAEIGGVKKGVHIWVYMTFNDCDIPKGMDVNHIDENPKNNRVDNLNLMTRKENVNWGTHNARMAAALRGRKRPDIAAALRGKKRPYVAAALSKAVQALDKNGNVIYEFPSTAEAQRQYGFHAGNISECCNGKRKSHKGYIWRYA